MINGKLALGGLSVEFGNAKKRFADLADRQKALTGRQTKLLNEEEDILGNLSRIYLPELSPEAVSSGLTELSSKMHGALETQAVHRRNLSDLLDELPEEVSRREFLVAEAEGTEERAARALDDARQGVELELGQSREHSEAVAEHASIMERRSVLKTRRARLQTTANVERYHYERDKPYAYLKRRAYGDPEYEAGFVTRWLDGWLAHQIDYETLNRNYRILRTGPHAIQADARKLTERAEKLETSIDAQEADVGARFGLAPALEAEAAAQRGLVDAREALDQVQGRHDRLATEIRAVDANRGRPYEEAIERHREFLETQTIRELLRIAESTPDPKDDGLVSRLGEIRTELTAVGTELAAVREGLQAKNSQATSLGELVRRAATHFMSRRSYFSEELNLPHLVRAIVEDEVNTEATLALIASSHVKQPLLVPVVSRDFDGWFAELSAQYDVELGAVELHEEAWSETDSSLVVFDHNGRILHRRVTRREVQN